MHCSCLNHLFLTIPIRFRWDSIRFNHFPGSIGPPWPKHHRDRRCAQRAWHFAPSTPWCYLPPAVAMLGAEHGKMLGTSWKPARNEDFTEKNDGQFWFPPRIWIYGIYGWIMSAKLVLSPITLGSKWYDSWVVPHSLETNGASRRQSWHGCD